MAEFIQTNLRLPTLLKERLNESADANARSLSAEVTMRLENSYVDQNHSSDMLRLSMRMERDLWKAQTEKDTLVMEQSVFAAAVHDAITTFQAGKSISDQDIKEILDHCRTLARRGRVARDASEITVLRFREAAAKLHALPDPRPYEDMGDGSIFEELYPEPPQTSDPPESRLSRISRGAPVPPKTRPSDN